MRTIFVKTWASIATGLRIATFAGLVVHFLLTVLYVLPINPVRLLIEPILQATIGTWFSQNWCLFAPNPLSSTQTLMVRCLTDGEAPEEGGPLPAAGWADLSSPLFERAHRNRLSAYERLVRPQENAVRGYLGNAVEFQPLIDRCAKDDKPACESLDRILKARRAGAAVLLRQLGSVYCREARPSALVRAVALRYRERYAVPWSERFHGTPKTTDFELGVYPLDPTVALPRLYLAEEAR
jgi:hypothetical protein